MHSHQLNGFLPGFTDDGTQATNHTEMVSGLWVNSWIVLLVVGIITWALMGWAAIAYRRRKGQRDCRCSCGTTCPIEIFYTVVPLILVLGFFAFTARDQAIIETQYDKPDVCITAIGKQWAWDFQYNEQECEPATTPCGHGRSGPDRRAGQHHQRSADPVPAGRQEGEDQAHLARRHPLLLDHRLPLQEGHVHREGQLLSFIPTAWASTTASAPSSAASTTR
jgi:heme/copper-type cytochrome/quinol oxidase subunit 2